MPREAKRRFLGLKVDEVSLVDIPANEVEFLVTKSIEESEMNDKQGAAGANQPADANDAVRVPVDAPAGGSDVTKALEHVGTIVDGIAKMFGAKTEEVDTNKKKVEEDEGEDTAKGMTVKGFLKACGITGEAMKACMEKLQKAGFDPNMKFPSAQPPVNTTKDTSGDQNVVEKAKQFTSERIAKLKSVMDTLKVLIQEIAPDTSPESTVPQVRTSTIGTGIAELSSGTPQPVFKSEDVTVAVTNVLKEALTPIVNVVAELRKSNEALATDVNAIKSARPATKSGGGDETATTETKKSFWGNVL